MKDFKNLLLLLLTVGVLFTLGSCGSDDEGATDVPSGVTVTADLAEGALPGDTVTITITFTGAGVTSISRTIDGGSPEVVPGQTTSPATDSYIIPAGTSSLFEITLLYTVSNSAGSGEGFATVTSGDQEGTDFAADFEAEGNQVVDPGFGATDIVPSATEATSGAMDIPDAFFDNTADYLGAVNPSGTPWYANNTWSFYAHILLGVSDKTRTQGGASETWSSATMDAAGNNVTWNKNTTYLLDGYVFVNDGQTLTIDAGTVIKGKPGTGEDAAALIVARGGTINANGTSTEPIIFTFEADPLDGSTGPDTRGQWGGVIILGKAGLNSSPGETAIEGIPTSETRGIYGGSNDNDDSGTLRYVSIRHGGSDIGEGNEINGLTLGGVGSGTTIEFVEIVGNTDDGIEWFGGTAQAKWIASVFCGDDALDYDEGYRGKNQFVIVHQDSNPGAADRGGEHDGGTDPETGTPFATPYFSHVTSVGNPESRAITFRDNAGGKYVNSIFINYEKGIDIELLSEESQNSFKQWQDGNLEIKNNIFSNIDGGSAVTGEDLFKVSRP